jgi:hypothetical protein
MFTRCRWFTLPVGAALIVALLAGSLGSAGVARAAEQAAPRLLGGHLFLPSSFVPDPFIATSFQTTTGGGVATNIDVPLYNLDGEQIGATSADIGFMALSFDYQQRISHRVDLRLAVNGSGRLGTSAVSIVAEGLSAVYGYGLGTTVNLVRKTNWELAASADVRGNTLYGVSPLGFVQSVIDNAANGDSALASSQDSLLSSGDNSRFVGGVRGAYTPAIWIGFTGYFEAGVGKKFTGHDANTSVVNFGATTSVDFKTLIHAPIGLLVQYRRQSLNEQSEEVGRSNSYGFGIFYTGRQDFALGLENTWSKLDQPRTSKQVNAAQFKILLRYDFQ